MKLIVSQSCPTLCDPMGYSPPSSSVHGIFQARILEWVANSFMQEIFLTQGLNSDLPHSGSGSAGKESASNAGTWVQSQGWEEPLEKGMTTHSSRLAWKIPWTEELGRLQSMGSQKVGHD